MGTGFVEITTLVALTQKSAKEDNLRTFTNSQMTETQHSGVESMGQTDLDLSHSPAWDLEHGT